MIAFVLLLESVVVSYVTVARDLFQIKSSQRRHSLAKRSKDRGTVS